MATKLYDSSESHYTQRNGHDTFSDGVRQPPVWSAPDGARPPWTETLLLTPSARFTLARQTLSFKTRSKMLCGGGKLRNLASQSRSIGLDMCVLLASKHVLPQWLSFYRLVLFLQVQALLLRASWNSRTPASSAILAQIAGDVLCFTPMSGPQHTLLACKASIGGGRQHRTSCHRLSMRSVAKISILICLDTSLHSSGGINCPCQTTSLRLWLRFPSASYHAAFQIKNSQNMIVHAQNPSFSGCFDNSTCFPNSPLLSRAMCFRRRSP